MSDVFVLVHPLCFGQQCYFQHSIQLQHHSRNVFSWKRTLKIAEIVFALFFFSIRKARSLKQDILIFFPHESIFKYLETSISSNQFINKIFLYVIIASKMKIFRIKLFSTIFNLQ